MQRISMVLGTLLAGVCMMTATPSPSRISLDGEWLFTADSGRVGVGQKWFRPEMKRTSWQKVVTPDFWEAYPGLASYDGWGWFVKSFTLESVTTPLSIHFAGVDDDAEVWINGKPVGEHTGYSDPFALDVSGAVRAGVNTIVVLVKDYSGGGGIYRPVTIVETAHLDELIRSPLASLDARQSDDWVRDGAIYSVYLRSFSPEGTFAGLEKRLPELKELGITTLWLMPIHPVGVKNRKGILGSPYSIQDYYGINPEFGTLDDFKHLLQSVHSQGMKLIIDLVANHTSWDSKLILEHPEWFTKDSADQIIAPNADWHDVADLDYSKTGLRAYMKAMMLYWVRDVGIDGFRCDVAELVPTDFWEDVREALDGVKPVMMLSEGSLPEQHVKAFDLTYSWNVYDMLDPVLSGKRPIVLLDQILRTEELQFPKGSLRMRFVTNHDKNAWDAPAVKKFGAAGLKLATVLVHTFPGVPLIYTGEEVANDRALSLFEKTEVDWSRPREMGEMNKSLIALRRDNPALARGEFIRLKGSAEKDVYAFLRVAGKSRVLVVLNFARTARTVTLQVPAGSSAQKGGRIRYRDLFLKRDWSVPVSARQVKLTLEPRGYRVFVGEE